LTTRPAASKDLNRIPQVVIENPIINSPFDEPTRHFRFADEGITNEIVAGRRISSYFVPIAQARKKGKQLLIETEWTQDRIEENKLVNDIRRRVSLWRQGGYIGVTPTTAIVNGQWRGGARSCAWPSASGERPRKEWRACLSDLPRQLFREPLGVQERLNSSAVRPKIYATNFSPCNPERYGRGESGFRPDDDAGSGTRAEGCQGCESV